MRCDIAQTHPLRDELKSKFDLRRLVFLDETWLKTKMTWLYGRSPRGQRAIGRSPHGHWQTTTFLAGLRHDRIVAPLVLDGPIDGVIFPAWFEQFEAIGYAIEVAPAECARSTVSLMDRVLRPQYRGLLARIGLVLGVLADAGYGRVWLGGIPRT